MSPRAPGSWSASPADADHEINSLVRETAQRLNERLPQISRGMSDLLADRIHMLDSDEDLVHRVDGRTTAGHWEGDLILGLDSSAIGTRVDRTNPLHHDPAPRVREPASGGSRPCDQQREHA